MLVAAPGLRPIAIFDEMIRRHPELGSGFRRTLERRIRGWRALHGAEREVSFQPAARPDPIEISVDIKLEQIAGRIARPACRLRLHPREACLDEIETIDEGVDEANGVVGADVVVHHFGQKKELVAFEFGNVSHAKF